MLRLLGTAAGPVSVGLLSLPVRTVWPAGAGCRPGCRPPAAMSLRSSTHARVAELADALDLGSSGQPWGFDSPLSHHAFFHSSDMPPAFRPERPVFARSILFINNGEVNMSVKIEDVSSVKKKLSFEVAAEQVEAEFDKAYQKVARSAKIKGFRPGKVPRAMIEQYYGPQMEPQALERLINDSYFKALVEHRIPAVSDPEIVESDSLERGKPFSYEAQVEVKPEIGVKDYAGLILEKEKFAPDAEVVGEGRRTAPVANRTAGQLSG